MNNLDDLPYFPDCMRVPREGVQNASKGRFGVFAASNLRDFAPVGRRRCLYLGPADGHIGQNDEMDDKIEDLEVNAKTLQSYKAKHPVNPR